MNNMFEMWFNYFTRDNSIPLFIQHGIHENYMFPHLHTDFYELVLVTDGAATHIVGDESLDICKGDIFVINRGSFHSYENARGLHIYNIMFKADVLLQYDKDFGNINGYRELFRSDGKAPFRSYMHLPPNVFDELKTLVQRIENEYTSRAEGSKALICAYFTQLVAVLSRLYGLPVKKREIEGITKAAEYIEEHYMEDCPIKEAIQLSNYSRRHFSRLFYEVYGVSPQDYLIGTRMRHAAHYLRNTGISIAEAAAKCGFTDSGYFSRVFKNHYGVLPSRYRVGNDK